MNYVVWLNYIDHRFSDFLSGPVFGHDAAGPMAGQINYTDRNHYSRSTLPAATPIVIAHLVTGIRIISRRLAARTSCPQHLSERTLRRGADGLLSATSGLMHRSIRGPQL